ncbi:DNA N-6-adenine-methyltransferase [Sphingobium yanoikuyae]|uniref:DNA N-6-adenine-methyltransferase n=1 Tax=Sphingobium yanoikuyae TaxID=13690 RepID=UPI000846CE81|nr:DNA N-6-adenine-methyltransferase [Sphingobium yanoikuyae]
MSHWEPSAGASDEWYTPPHVFSALGCHFDLDVAAPFAGPPHVPCNGFIYDRSLERAWSGFVWMNPPYGGRNSLDPWLDKFFAYGNGICLVPDRTSAPWFQRSFKKADAVLFTRKIRFLRPDGSEGKSPSNGSALMAVGERGVEAVMRASRVSGLGILAIPHDRVAEAANLLRRAA